MSEASSDVEYVGNGRQFVTAEIETYQPGYGGEDEDAEAPRAWGTGPWGVRTRALGSLEITSTIRVSDIGYRTATTDNPALTPYPPLLAEGFAVSRKVPLAPSQASAGAAWGALKLLNGDRMLDVYLPSNSDARPVRIRIGRKQWDEARGYEIDPPYALIRQVFAGVATPWAFGEGTLEIPLRDATYWIERPYQNNLYAGTGGLEGPDELKGRPKPRTRGGTAQAPVQNITPVLVDSVNRIYQWTDGPGTVVNLYEGGDAQIPYDGDTGDLYSGAVASGHFRTDNARGLFQLGTRSFRTITCDVTGAFPVAGAKSSAMDVVIGMLKEDMQLPEDFLDLTTLLTVNEDNPAPTGWYWSGEERVQGVDAIMPFFTSIAAKMVPLRDGRLSCLLLRPPAGGGISRFTSADIIKITPVSLGAPLDPPAAVWQAGYARNFTVQIGELDPDVTEERQGIIGETWRSGTWVGNDVIAAYRRPSTPDIVETALLVKSDGDNLAAIWGALWGVRRRCYEIEVLADRAFAHDIGEQITLAYPLDDLDAGRTALIVGDALRTGSPTATLRVLV